MRVSRPVSIGAVLSIPKLFFRVSAMEKIILELTRHAFELRRNRKIISPNTAEARASEGRLCSSTLLAIPMSATERRNKGSLSLTIGSLGSFLVFELSTTTDAAIISAEFCQVLSPIWVGLRWRSSRTQTSPTVSGGSLERPRCSAVNCALHISTYWLSFGRRLLFSEENPRPQSSETVPSAPANT